MANWDWHVTLIIGYIIGGVAFLLILLHKSARIK